MPTVANSLFDRNAPAIKEEIGNRATELMTMSEPLFADTIIDDTGLETGNNILGRDMRIRQTFYGALAGVIRGGNQNSNFGLYGDATTALGSKMYLAGANKVFPNPMEGTNPTPFGFTSKLYSVETNLALSLSMLQLEATPANIKEHVTPVLRGLANNLNLWACNSVHVNQENSYRIASLGPNSSTGAYTLNSTDKTITFYPVEKCTHRFATGQPVDIFVSTTRINEISGVRILMVVSSVDDWENKVVLQTDTSGFAVDGTTAYTWTTAFTTTTLGNSTGFVVQANTYSSGFAGMYSIRDFLKWGGSTNALKRLLGSSAVTDDTFTPNGGYIDVTVHPEFKSGHFASVGSINERKLLSHLATVNRAMIRQGHRIDTLMASDGIFLNIFDQYLSREQVIRGTGGSLQPGSLQTIGLKKGFQIVYDGGTLSGETSQFIESGVMYAIRRQGNWRFIIPPDPTGTSRGGLPDLKSKIPLVFVSKALGGASDRTMLLKTSGGYALPTEFCHMPGYIRMQFMPREQIPGCVWEGVSETRVYSAP